MARRLAFHKLVLGIALATTAVDLSSMASAQPSSQEPAAKSTGEKPVGDQPQEKPTSDSKDPPDHNRGDDKHDGDKKREGRDGRGGGRGEGGRNRGPNPDFFLQVMKNDPAFLTEVVKRDGGPLELLAPLMKPEVREHMGLDAQHAKAVDQFLADMTKRFEENIKANKEQPNADWQELFKKMLEDENSKFDEFLTKELPAEQRNRLIGIFVQLRNMRALSNRLVAVEKMGISAERASQLREDIHRIRMETIRENDDWARRRIENGSTVQLQEQFEKMRAKIDARIEKLLTKEELEKLKALRGKELPPAVRQLLDLPPGPPPGPPRKD